MSSPGHVAGPATKRKEHGTSTAARWHCCTEIRNICSVAEGDEDLRWELLGTAQKGTIQFGHKPKVPPSVGS